jgi:hypothetical protein
MEPTASPPVHLYPVLHYETEDAGPRAFFLFVLLRRLLLRQPHLKPQILPAKRHVYLCTTTCPQAHSLPSNGAPPLAIARTIPHRPPQISRYHHRPRK